MFQIEKSELVQDVIGCAIAVHEAIGAGVFESMYEECLAREFTFRCLEYERQVRIPVVYREANVDCSFRADFVVRRRLIVELKTVEQILPVHRCQVQTYLRMLNLRQGLVLNFNVSLMKNGIASVLNPRYREEREEVQG